MQETDAILGGELSGHICFQERWYGFDDGLYAAARLLEIVGTQSEGLSELLQEFPTSIATPEITIPVAESRKFDLMDAILERLSFADATVTDIDGLRVDFSNGWGLVRASNTTASLTLRFEADDEAALESIKNQFREQLAGIDAGLQF
jgi:phosphomannomutase/phosphoglucomutase